MTTEKRRRMGGGGGEGRECGRKETQNLIPCAHTRCAEDAIRGRVMLEKRRDKLPSSPLYY